MNYSNIQRDWSDLSYSERASVIADAYYIQEVRGKYSNFIEEINQELNIRATNIEVPDSLSPRATRTVRSVGNDFNLKRDTLDPKYSGRIPNPLKLIERRNEEMDE